MPCDIAGSKRPDPDRAQGRDQKAVDKLAAALAAGKVKPVIGATGGIAFPGWVEGADRRVGDGYALSRLFGRPGSVLGEDWRSSGPKTLAGRRVDRQAWRRNSDLRCGVGMARSRRLKESPASAGLSCENR